MTGRTHAAAGAFFGALAGHAAGSPEAGAAIGALAALLPDVDTPGSIIGRRVRFVSVLLEALAGHRTVCHTVWFCLLVAAGFAALGSWAAGLVPGASALWGFPALAGGLSHLALDAATVSGVEPFAPLALPGRLAFLAHPHGPLKTGAWWQEIPAMLAFLMLALAALKL